LRFLEMRSYVKIYGPPVNEAIKALERVAVDMPEICVMDRIILKDISPQLARDIGLEAAPRRAVSTPSPVTTTWVEGYFESSRIPITTERCTNIISKSGTALGNYDFFFEWFEKPGQANLNAFIGKIDEALAGLGCMYTITTK
jgi:hypothetical protein